MSPDYRITCMFVDKKYRRNALTAVALRGALDLISQVGGGIVEGYPHDTGGQKVSVLYNGTRILFEQAGFSYVRPKGLKNCVMRKAVPLTDSRVIEPPGDRLGGSSLSRSLRPRVIEPVEITPPGPRLTGTSS